MAKELMVKANTENDIRIFKSRTPRVGDTIVICGDVDPVVYTAKDGGKWLNALPCLVNGIPTVLPISSWAQATFEGSNCFPQNAFEVTALINSATSWSELCGLAGTPFKVEQHFNFNVPYKDRSKGTYNWTTIGCSWVEEADHEFSEAEIASLNKLVAEAQAKLSK